jgi:uncharacterized protein (DUF885 family)
MPTSQTPPTVAADLAGLIDDYLKFVFLRDPIEATQQGIHDHDATLGDHSVQAYADEIAQRQAFVARFAAVDATALDDDAAMDLAVARIDVATSLRRLEARPLWTSAPYWYVEQLGSAFAALMRGDGQTPNAQGERLWARLRLAPRYLATVQANLTPATAPLHVAMGLTAIKGLRSFLTQAVPGFAQTLDATLQADLAQATLAVHQALDDIERFLQAFGAQAQGSFACGPEMFDFLLKEFHLLDLDHRQLHEFGMAEMARDRAALEAYARTVDPTRTWMALIEEVKNDHPQGDQFLAVYHAEMVRARAHCVRADLITLPPGEAASVQWLPEYLRAGAPLGLMFTTPPFAPGLASELVITPLDPDAPPDKQLQHMRDNCVAFARSITLHEIYPGHHTQKVHHKLATAQSPMRRLFSSPVLVEGWGLYTEDLMEERGFMEEPGVRLFKLRNALWRSARVVVDSGLHTRGMGFDEAVDFMVDEVHLDRRMAEGEVRRYTTHDNPTYPSAYLLGKTAIHTLRRQVQTQQGDGFMLRAFHDRLLSYGSPPVKLIAQRMLGAEG